MAEFSFQKKEEEQKPSTGFFSRKVALEPSPETNNLISQTGDLSRRVRMIEERYDTLRKRNQMTDQNMLSNFKKVNTETKTLSDEIRELKIEIDDIKNKMLIIVKELKLCAKKEDLDVLNRYVNLWNPVSFVTQDGVEKIVKRVLEENQKI